MEEPKELSKELAKLSLQSFLPALPTTRDSNEVSIYSGELTAAGIGRATVRINQAFPQLPEPYLDLLKERFIEKGFTDQRVMDAVNYVIDNIPYPVPAPANFLSFDRRVKLNTHDQMERMSQEWPSCWESYQAVKKIDADYHASAMWVLKNDFDLISHIYKKVL